MAHKTFILLILVLLLGCAPYVTVGDKFVLNDVEC